MAKDRPIVGIPCDRKMLGDLPYHAVGEKYIDAVRDIAGALPLLIPVTCEPLDVEELLGIVDGLFLPGSGSNVSPKHYSGPASGALLDEARDGTALPLIKTAIDQGKPLFAVCRGLQELNVALGGTLDQKIESLPGRLDHSEKYGAPEEVRYGPAHPVDVTAGGVLERITRMRRFEVNSLHSEAIARLAPGLAIEAQAADGTIEAVSRPGSRGFLLAVQWHPEWRAAKNPISVRLFEAFGEALRVARAKDHRV
ncbi:MAG TPA: gamma-glutamyl-gamma-aminobutyrate hydrolase family protein [Alphaproteobacteria bacterium]|nr:gamma-glutamyl-gamma-aminobutyrate hydrolase family protein [Alphaproteobacteria bacterium]